MPDDVKIEELPVQRDARGWIFEPLEPGDFPGQRNSHIVSSEPGSVRGNHYHVRGTEVIVVIGPALVRYRRGQDDHDVVVADGKAVRFTFPPGVAHAIQNTGPRPTLMIAFNTEVHDRDAPDVVRVLLISPPVSG